MLKQTLYEDDDDREDRIDRVAIIEEKVKDYEEHLLAIEEALWGLGCFKDEEGNFQPAAEVQIVKGYNQEVVAQAPQSGINIRHALSFRGQQKAEEYFDRLDEDRDGFLTFEDFRAMASLGRYPLGTVHDNVHASWDAWKMHMADAGAPPDFVGRVTRDQFVRYRTWLERRPREVHLEPEITRAGLGILPKTQQLWVAIKGVIEEVILEREYQELLRKESESAKAELADLLKGKNDNGPKLPVKERFYDEILDLDEMQYVLVTVGIVYPRGLLAHLMRERAQREKLLEHFSAKKMRRVYGDSPHKMLQFMSPQGTLRIPREPITLKRDDVKFIKVSQFLAWCFADRVPPPRSDGVYRLLLRAKYLVYRFIRQTNVAFKLVYEVGQHLRARSVFRDFQPIPTKPAAGADKATKCSAVLNVTVGRGGMIDNPGIEATGRLYKLEGPMLEAKCTKMRFPKDYGTVLSFDLDVRTNAVREDVRDAVDALKLLLRFQLEPELRKCAPFKSLLVYPAFSDSDGGKTIRVAIVFKRAFSVDAFLTYLALPYGLMDLVQEFNFDFKANMSLHEMFSSSFAVLEGAFSARLEAKLLYAKGHLSAAMDRAIQAMNFAPTAKQAKTPQNERDLKFYEVLERLRKVFPAVTAALSTALTYLRGLRTSAVKLRFPRLTDLLERLGLVSLWAKWHLPTEISTGLGYMFDAFNAWRKTTDDDLKGIYEDLRNHMEDLAEREEAERLRKKAAAQKRFDDLSTVGSDDASVDDLKRGGGGDGSGGSTPDGSHEEASRASNATKASLVEKLKRLGITNDSLDMLLDDDEPRDPKEYASFVLDNTKKSDTQTYIVWEKLAKVCNGLNSVDIFCGKGIFQIGVSGLDLFPLVPEAPSMAQVKEDIAQRKQEMRKLRAQLKRVGVSEDLAAAAGGAGAGGGDAGGVAEKK